MVRPCQNFSLMHTHTHTRSLFSHLALLSLKKKKKIVGLPHSLVVRGVGAHMAEYANPSPSGLKYTRGARACMLKIPTGQRNGEATAA